ncbi:MAG: hypothetical protein HOP23_01130 [Methylococcaceae bacterium]|nr:hypothetical protein [Methylococcaceae bacterium]
MILRSTLLITLPLISGCSIHDVQQVIARKDLATLIRQDNGHNIPTQQIGSNPVTRLDSATINAKAVPVSESTSLAAATENLTLESVLKLPPATTLTQARATMIQYLAVTETHPEAIEKLLFKAEQLVKTYSDDPQLQTLFQQLARYSEWQPVNSIINNGGLSFVASQGWQPESPFIRTRRALLPPVAENEHVIFGDQRLVLLLTNVAKIQLHIDARLEDIPFLPESPAQLTYQLDERPPQHLRLADQEDWKRFTINIPTGEHQVRLYQQTPVGNQYVKLRFDDQLTNLSVAQERPYFISTTQAPLEFYSQGPTVLRIDEWDEGVISYRYQNVAEGWQKVSLPPSTGKQKSLLRVNERVVNFEPKPIRNRIVQRNLVPVDLPETVLKKPVAAGKVQLDDTFKLGKQEDGTLSLSVDFVRRNNKQEGGKTLPLEQFAQYRINYRYFDEPRDIYWNTQGFFRYREFGGPTVGIDESVYYNPDWLPFNIRTGAKIITQVPHDQLEWLGQWNITASQSYNLTPKFRLIPNLSLFARTMSLRNSQLARNDEEFGKKIDQDIFTPYKADHTAGLHPALSMEYSPWLDTLWTGKLGLTSNENMDIGAPDHFSDEVHWKQLLGSVVLDGFYRAAYYQKDFDRIASETRSYLGLELNWQRWAIDQHRIELSGQYSYDIERKSHLATLSLTVHFGEGRGYRDFAPCEIDFREIRQRTDIHEQNNTIKDVND